jgi:type IV pilus assembly protein PilX
MKRKQQGVALIMTLVFLVLMTLISTSAIQQNSLQFSMIGNTQEQNQTFARAENILKLAERSIETLRWSDARSIDPDDATTNTECKAAGGNYTLIPPGTSVGNAIDGSTAVIQSWWCQNNPADTDNDGFGEAAECSIDDANCPTIPTSGHAPSPNTYDYPAGEIGCGTELYTIQVTYMQSNAERVVESRYAVKCLKAGV